jgi:uncharacterized protein YndB with AHSA1/START domain
MSAAVTVSREIAAPADTVWAMLSDVTRMGEWSPENTGAEWLGGATGLAVGARFRGSNSNGKKSWKTLATVTQVDPGRSFTFRVTAMGLKVADWSYSVQPTETGCRVTESCTDIRPGFFRPIAKMATGVADRDAHNRTGMERTLDELAAVAEAEPT